MRRLPLPVPKPVPVRLPVPHLSWAHYLILAVVFTGSLALLSVSPVCDPVPPPGEPIPPPAPWDLSAAPSDVRLDYLAGGRVRQLTECVERLGFDACWNHNDFPSVVPGLVGSWYGEVLAASSVPISIDIAEEMWFESPPHLELLLQPRDRYGFATSSVPSAGGLYFAAALVEAD